MVAVPVPVPTPVAVNVTPTVFDAAPINVKSVVPIDAIVYLIPTVKLPAVTVDAAPLVTRSLQVTAWPVASMLFNVPVVVAVPVPEPTPVATKTVPTVLLAAPIKVKFVVPADTIVYVAPTIKLPATVAVPAAFARKFRVKLVVALEV